MERLTTTSILGGYTSCSVKQEVVDRLAEYENSGLTVERAAELGKADQEGRVVVLPCKVGDTVYTNTSMKGWYLRAKNRPYEAKVVFIGINGVNDFLNIEIKDGMMLPVWSDDIGTPVFLTREEAEKALEAENHERPDNQ